MSKKNYGISINGGNVVTNILLAGSNSSGSVVNGVVNYNSSKENVKAHLEEIEDFIGEPRDQKYFELKSKILSLQENIKRGEKSKESFNIANSLSKCVEILDGVSNIGNKIKNIIEYFSI